MSFDTVEENAAFAAKHAFPYPLLCDTGRDIGVAYGACADRSAGAPRRISYLIGPDRRIRAAWGKVDPRAHPAEVLETLASE